LDLGAFIQRLEEVVIKTLSDFTIRGQRREAYRGVWIDREKIASVGIAVRGGITFHGIALNYDPDLSHFDLINPCGLNGVRMTSMSRILGKKIRPSELRRTLASHFEGQFGLHFTGWSRDEAEKLLGRTPRVSSSLTTRSLHQPSLLKSPLLSKQ
jgi:lipoate-protein ligase B